MRDTKIFPWQGRYAIRIICNESIAISYLVVLDLVYIFYMGYVREMSIIEICPSVECISWIRIRTNFYQR